MDLLMLRSMWSAPRTLDTLIGQTVACGFDGIEGPIPTDPPGRRALRTALEREGLAFVAEATTGLPDGENPHDWWVPDPSKGVADHLNDLRRTVDAAGEMRALFVTTMCGRDAWGWSENRDFFGAALDLSAGSGVPISFETHRCRSLYNPWTTRDLLREFPGMRLTCDFSHWCVVCERLVDTEADILDLCATRAQHVHARVGDAQRAQVADPRAPEYAGALAAHERWWDAIWASHAARGADRITMTAEWGDDGYTPRLPYTRSPVVALWEITCWVAERQRARFAAWQDEFGPSGVSRRGTKFA